MLTFSILFYFLFRGWHSSLGIIVLQLLLSHFSCVRLCATHKQQPTRLPHPWDSPGKNTGVGCHFLLQFMKVKSESEVAQSCPTPSDPMDCSPPGSSTHGICQARVLEWGAITFSRFYSIYFNYQSLPSSDIISLQIYHKSITFYITSSLLDFIVLFHSFCSYVAINSTIQ